MKKRTLLRWTQLVAGSLLFPVAVRLFLDPSHLNTGGFIGAAQILSWLVSGGATMSLAGIINMFFNIPLFILAWKKLSPNFFMKTVVSVVLQAVTMSFLPQPAIPIMPDPLSNAIIGGAMGGLGVGLCLRAGGCAGGIDILGVYFSKVRPNFSVGQLSYIINAFVLGASAFLFDLQTALYSLVFVLITYTISDKVHIQNINVWALIITTNPELKHIINNQMIRGASWWPGRGAYTGQPQEIIVTAINKYEVRELKQIVRAADPKAFVILNDGSPIRGNFEKRIV